MGRTEPNFDAYIVADGDLSPGGGWSHIFDESGTEKERDCRFVWDISRSELIALEIRRNHRWEAADGHEVDDLQDSLVNANPWAIDPEHPDGLPSSDELPDWAMPQPAAPSLG